MTEKPNCGNCSYANGQCKSSLVESYDVSFEVGLMCHPNARAYLMAPVIAELEQMINNAEKIRMVGTHQRIAALKQAIALIRDGVK